MKCDETKPSCHRCTDAQRVCGFLHPMNEKAAITPKPKGKKPVFSQALMLRFKLASPLCSPFGVDEFTHFDFFRGLYAKSSSRYFDGNLWDRTILQMTHSEASIRNVVVALAGHIRSENSPLTIRAVGRQESRVKYLQALQSFNRSLDTTRSSSELALVAGLLFASYVVLCGQSHDGELLKHFEAGQGILREYAAKSLVPYSFRCCPTFFSLFS